jgi:hypothetical protein
MRRHHPQAARDPTGDAAAQREDELAFAMPVVVDFRPVADDVDADGDYRRGELIDIEIGPWVAKWLPHG